MPLPCIRTGDKPTTQVCALSRNRNCGLSVHGMMFQPIQPLQPRQAMQFLTGVFSSTIKMITMKFMLLTKAGSQEKHRFWIPVQERSLWKAEPMCTAITKSRSSGAYSKEEGELGPATVSSSSGDSGL